MKRMLLILSLGIVAVSAMAQPIAYEQAATFGASLLSSSGAEATTIPLLAAGLVALGAARRRAR